MQKRRIRLEDGRYLIFYTFDDEAAIPPVTDDAEQPKSAPEAEAGEERRV